MPNMQFIRGERERTLRTIDAYIDKNLEVPIIVEGAKDMEALRKLGFKGKIIVFNSGLSVVAFSEELSRTQTRVIILVDFDRTGRILRKRISSILSATILEVDTNLWAYIRRHLPIRTVEELPSIIEVISKTARGVQAGRKNLRRKAK